MLLGKTFLEKDNAFYCTHMADLSEFKRSRFLSLKLQAIFVKLLPDDDCEREEEKEEFKFKEVFWTATTPREIYHEKLHNN